MLGFKIKNYLEENGIKQTFISDKTGIPLTTLNQILNGNRKILAEEYFSICEVLHINANYIYYEIA